MKPILMFAWLDGHVRAAEYTDADLRWLARRLAEGGVDYLRLLPEWGGKLSPFEWWNGRADLTVSNLDWDNQLCRVCRAMHEYGVRVAMDVMDHCAHGKAWNPWSYNINEVRGIYDTQSGLLHCLKWFCDRARNSGVDMLGLGNELSYPNFRGDMQGLHKWTETIVLPLARYIKRLTRQPWHYYSADCAVAGTANKIVAYLTEPEYGGYHRSEVIQVLHGMGVPEDWKQIRDADILSVAVSYGMSDDGVGCNTSLPPDKRGLCEEPGKRCKASQAWRLQTVKAMGNDLGDRLRLIEFLAPEIAMPWNPPAKLDWEYSINTYRKALDWYGLPLPDLHVEPKPEPPIVKVRVTVCRYSGLLPNPHCPELEEREYTAGSEPTTTCVAHHATEPLPEPPPLPEKSCAQKYLSGGVRKWQPLKYLRCLLRRK